MNLQTPNGVKDIMPREYEFKKSVESRIETVFYKYGYRGVSPALIEYHDVFTGAGSVDTNKIYRFVDSGGDILALRPDVTPQIARITAANKQLSLPARFSYIENVYRRNINLQGKQNEFTQAGAEIYGASCDDADAEAVLVAVEALLAAGLTEFNVCIGNVEFLRAALAETNLSQTEQAIIRRHIQNKDFVSAGEAVKGRDIPSGIKEILTNLALCVGGESVLDMCEAKTKSAEAKAAAANLRSISDTLKYSGLGDYIMFDLSLTGHLDYYTGVIFRGYTPGSGFSVLEGGRCDYITRPFGEALPAVGFAVNIDSIMRVLPEQKVEPLKADTLIAYENGAKQAAYAAARKLRREGLFAENALGPATIEQSVAYSKSAELSGVLFFKENGDIVLHDIKTDKGYDVTVDMILNGVGE